MKWTVVSYTSSQSGDGDLKWERVYLDDDDWDDDDDDDDDNNDVIDTYLPLQNCPHRLVKEKVGYHSQLAAVGVMEGSSRMSFSYVTVNIVNS